VALESGPNATLVVAADADLNAAAHAMVRSGLHTSDQACIPLQRITAIKPAAGQPERKITEQRSPASSR
jgi:acyl-CoA reductase-like NAD-dependent aldehyde dehydrogenase